MRWLLLAAAVAVAGVASLLVINDPEPKRPSDRQAGPMPNGNGPVPVPLPDAQADPAAFLAECERRGEASLGDLLKFLESGKDVAILPRWLFRNGKLEGYPTLRAIYLEAVRRVQPHALRKVLVGTDSVEESYFIALALRDEGGWTKPVLDRAAARARPLLQEIQRKMVRLAAQTDPAGAAAYLLQHAPRGEQTDVPRILATGIEGLPEKEANATAETLLTDKQITVQAKVMYLRSLCARKEISALETVTALIERRQLSERMATEAVYLAADAGGFQMDAVDYQQAISKGDREAAAKVRERFDKRFDQVHRLVLAATNLDLRTSEDPRAKALNKLLERNRKRLP